MSSRRFCNDTASTLAPKCCVILILTYSYDVFCPPSWLLTHLPLPVLSARTEGGGWIMPREKLILFHWHRLSHQGRWPGFYFSEFPSLSHTPKKNMLATVLMAEFHFFATGKHPNQDLWDGEGSRSRPKVHRSLCSADRRGVWWLQDRHGEKHGPGASCWKHPTNIRCQH